jgi:hypothetical protein
VGDSEIKNKKIKKWNRESESEKEGEFFLNGGGRRRV